MPPDPPKAFLNQLQICFAEKNTPKTMWKFCPLLLKFLATPLTALIVGEENLVIGFGPPTLEILPPSLILSQVATARLGWKLSHQSCDHGRRKNDALNSSSTLLAD